MAYRVISALLLFLSFNASASSFTSKEDFIRLRDKMWLQVKNMIQDDAQRKQMHENRVLEYRNSQMRFSLEKIGKKPESGYPLYIALHGGGATSKVINDSQWSHMKIYYKTSVDVGIYTAVRGISDNWNLHFEDNSYPMYDRLIENMIAFEDVDPNRVYILGFSAGGDGVYQIPTRMADRFAAANMSAGHANNIDFYNLSNTPFLMQMGARDFSYERNKDIARNYIKFQNLKTSYSSFEFDAFIHPNKAHNGWPDNLPSVRSAPVMKNPISWLNEKDESLKNVDTNAVRWVKKHTRDPLARELVWDLSTRALREDSYGEDYSEESLSAPKDLFYWLRTPDENAEGLINISFDKKSNSIHVKKATDIEEIEVLLNPLMLDLNEPIKVITAEKETFIEAQPCNKETLLKSLLERSDPKLAYCSSLKINL